MLYLYPLAQEMDTTLRESRNPYPDYEWDDDLIEEDLSSPPSRVTFDDKEIA